MLPTPARLRAVAISYLALSLLHLIFCVWIVVEVVQYVVIDWVVGMLTSLALSTSIVYVGLAQQYIQKKPKRIEPNLCVAACAVIGSFFAICKIVEIAAHRQCCCQARANSCDDQTVGFGSSFVAVMCSTVASVVYILFNEMLRAQSIRTLLNYRFNDAQVPVSFNEASAADRIVDMSEMAHHD